MKLKMTVVDAFTRERFKGNPAAVVITETPLPDALMQSIATENNLSETAFIVRQADGKFAIRWFSPLTEVDFCGHATLASAFVLFNLNPEFSDLTFYAKAVGEMRVGRREDGAIVMNFPNRKPKSVDDVPAALLAGLSVKPNQVLRSQQAYFAIYDNEQDVLTLSTDSEALKILAPYDVVVSAASKQYDFVSRYFWPANGGDEDPVTGSIHAGLAPYWAEQLGSNQLTGYQASSRGGVVECTVDNDRVIVAGHAVQYLTGEIDV